MCGSSISLPSPSLPNSQTFHQRGQFQHYISRRLCWGMFRNMHFFLNKFWYILIKFSRLTERSTSINNVFYIQDSHLIITCNHSFQTRSGPRSRFQVLTRSSGSIFLKIKMASKSTGCNWIFDRIAGSHRVFSSSIFSSTRPDSSFESRVDPPGRVLKLCLKHLPSSLKLPWAILHPIHF
jgi:hypothetical protein